MPLNAGSVLAKFTSDITNFKQGISQAKDLMSGLKGVGSSLGASLQSTFSAIGNSIVSTLSSAVQQAKMLATGLVVAGVAGITAIGKSAIDTAKYFEQAEIAYTTLLKDGKEAKKVLGSIQEDAKKTPFNLRELVLANQLLISAGESADGSRKVIKDLGNAISATGGGAPELARLAVNLQQIKALGKATALDVRQFAFAGINIYKLLAETTGKNVEEVREMDISYELLTESLAKASESGGMFEGAMEAQSKSLQGLISNMQDVISLTLKDIVVNTGLFDAVKRVVDGIIRGSQVFAGFIELLRTDDLESFSQAMKTFGFSDEQIRRWAYIAGAIRGFFEMLKTDDMESFSNSMQKLGFSEATISGFGKFAGYLRDFGNWVVANKETVLTFLQGLAIALGALLIIGTIAGLITALTNPLVLVIGALALLYTAWQTNFLGIRDITGQVVSAITAFWQKYGADFMAIWEGIKSVVNLAVEQLKGFWTNWGGFITTYTQQVMNILGAIIKFAFEAILNIIRFVVAVFTGDWRSAWEAVKGIAQAGFNFLSTIFGSLKAIAEAGMQAVFNAVTGWLGKAWNKAKEIANNIREAIASAFDTEKRNSPSIMDRLRDVKDSTEKILGSIALPNFSHEIAGSLAGVNLGGLAVGGESGSSKVVNQYITANIKDTIDINTLSEQLAFKARTIT